ncbi:hypothetical protein GDO86_001050 [Hymenochirus boettgeri]|uniref:Uncharacterized protein n=1 Tax=Hymenochirus boettgeri TaxID=247094 RepID=A0A8T2KDC0_9PIPI|nr:hypothetical protein GDO86_001050 [Hymenochirus boettgeri]
MDGPSNLLLLPLFLSLLQATQSAGDPTTGQSTSNTVQTNKLAKFTTHNDSIAVSSMSTINTTGITEASATPSLNSTESYFTSITVIPTNRINNSFALTKNSTTPSQNNEYPKSTTMNSANGSSNATVPGTHHPVNGTSSPVSQAIKDLTGNPGLVAVICIFISILCISLVVITIKFCQNGEPEFQKLDEVPMGGLNEEAPFARYPPK